MEMKIENGNENAPITGVVLHMRKVDIAQDTTWRWYTVCSNERRHRIQPH